MGYHDLFFKQTFSIREHAIDFIKHTLPPEVTMGINYATVALEKGSHVDAALAEHFSEKRLYLRLRHCGLPCWS